MHSKNILILLLVLLIAGVGSLFLGSAVASSDFATIGAFIAGAVALCLYLLLGKDVWVLIPIFAAWQGSLGFLPLPFSVNNLVVGFVVLCWIINILTRRENLRHQFTGLDMIIAVFVMVLAIGYIRNPVSVAALGGSSVGARPYFEIGMGLMAYMILSSIRVSSVWINRVPYLTVLSCVFLAIGGTVAYFLPELGMILSKIYSGFVPNMSELQGDYEGGSGITRASYLTPLAIAITALLYAKRAPLMNLNPRTPGSVLSLGLALSCALLSGFRGALGAQVFYFSTASWMWWRGKGLAMVGVLASVCLIGIFTISTVIELPLGVQRSLSFLPGQWDSGVVENADRSNEFRFDLWHRAWYEGGIENVWIGDGFRIPEAELDYQKELMKQGYVKEEDRITYYLITGDLHSGPLSAIKYVGLLGLVVFIMLAAAVAIQAYKLWNVSIQRNGKMLIGFYTLPMIYFPFLYVFIFGSFRLDAPRLLVYAGLIVLLKNVMTDALSHDNKEKDEVGKIVR